MRILHSRNKKGINRPTIIQIIFNLAALYLLKIAQQTGRTYNEINIILYYFLIPLSWLILLDCYFHFIYLSFAYIVICFGIILATKNFRTASDTWFKKSVRFLNYFNRLGSNYYASSVWICVCLPICVYIVLFYLILN